MKVTLCTYGGLTGIGQPPVVAETETMSAATQHELHVLVAAATSSGAVSPSSGPSDHSADALSYEITIDADGHSTVLEATDGSVPDDFASLRDWLRAHCG